MRVTLALMTEAKPNPKEPETQPDTGMAIPGAISFTCREVHPFLPPEESLRPWESRRQESWKPLPLRKNEVFSGAREEADLERKRGQGAHRLRPLRNILRVIFVFTRKKKKCVNQLFLSLPAIPEMKNLQKKGSILTHPSSPLLRAACPGSGARLSTSPHWAEENGSQGGWRSRARKARTQ